MSITDRLKRVFNRQQEANSGYSVTAATALRLSPDDRIRQLIRQEMFRQAMGQEQAETFEEADDFDFDEDEEWVSPYEVEFEPPSSVTVADPSETTPKPAAAEPVAPQQRNGDDPAP